MKKNEKTESYFGLIVALMVLGSATYAIYGTYKFWHKQFPHQQKPAVQSVCPEAGVTVRDLIEEVVPKDQKEPRDFVIQLEFTASRGKNGSVRHGRPRIKLDTEDVL